MLYCKTVIGPRPLLQADLFLTKKSSKDHLGESVEADYPGKEILLVEDIKS